MSSKVDLRRHMASVLAKLSTDSIQHQSQLIYDKLLIHPRYQQATQLSIYLSVAREVDTISLLKRALEIDHKRCFIPFIAFSSAGAKSLTGDYKSGTCANDEPRMRMIELRSMSQYADMPLNHYGIKQPESLSDHECLNGKNLDNLLVIVPGVAFTSDGDRLGHGKGYYDEYLSRLIKDSPPSKRPYTIGLAFSQQIVKDVPVVQEHDFKLDEVLAP